MEIEEIKKTLQDNVDEGDWYPGDTVENIKYVADQDIAKGRWTTEVLAIIDVDGELYGYRWERALTEEQEDMYPWEWKNWDLFRVGVREVVVKEYF